MKTPPVSSPANQSNVPFARSLNTRRIVADIRRLASGTQHCFQTLFRGSVSTKTSSDVKLTLALLSY